jgi:SAM-dependent MidA family methyltransferase
MGVVQNDLGARLRRRIEDSGPITFAEFMDAALYDPDGGFFEGGGLGEAGSTVGAGGDFVTSPHVSPLFGGLLARLVEEARGLLGDPPLLTVVDVGAGDGSLAGDLAAGLAVPERTELILVERTAAHRARLASLVPSLPCRARVARSASDLASEPVVGLVLANELLDNLPFHRVRHGPAGPRELLVGTDGGDLVLVEGPPSSPAVEAAGARLPVGTEGVVPSGAFAFLAEARAALDRGYVVLVDYAAGAADAGVHGYRGQRPVGDVLSRPGTADVTAGVDFGLLAAHAAALGLRSWGTVTQRDLLLSLGYGEETDRLRDRQAVLLNEGRGAEATRLFSARSRASLLVDRGGLGGFLALCLDRDALTAPGPWASAKGRDRG